MIQKVNEKDWIPVGNYVLVSPISLVENKFVPEEFKQNDCFEVLGFGTSYEAIDELKIGDKVIIIEYDGKKEGTVILLRGKKEIWCYPPHSIVAKYSE